MKTRMAISLVGGLFFSAPAFQATDSMYSHRTPDQISHEQITKPILKMIGAGTVREKNGNNFTIDSDDGNTYQAPVIGIYKVGDYVLHSDPHNGWVQILGHG